MELVKLFIKSALIDNVVLVQFLALCPFIGLSTDVKKATGMGVAVTFVMLLATAVTYPLYYLVLAPLNIKFLQTLTFILVIAALVQLVEFYLKKCVPALYSSMGVYLALITTNCAILGTALNMINKNFTFVESFVYAFGTAAGFLLALVMMSGIRARIKSSPVPSFLKGTPILFIAAALLSMAMSGFSGMIK